MVVQPWEFITSKVKDEILGLQLEIEHHNNLFMILQFCKFTSTENIKDGILELLLEIECPHTSCMVQQS